jgi:hypothetical protein
MLQFANVRRRSGQHTSAEMTMDSTELALDGLIGLVTVGLGAILNVAFGKADRAEKLANQHHTDIEYLKKSYEKLSGLPVKIARMDSTMKQVLRSVSVIEAHVLRGQAAKLAHDEKSENNGDENNDDDDSNLE